MIETNIIYFLRCRELNIPFRGKIVVYLGQTLMRIFGGIIIYKKSSIGIS